MNDAVMIQSEKTMQVAGQTYHYHDLTSVEQAGWGSIARLPMTLKIVLENLLRAQTTGVVQEQDLRVLANWNGDAGSDHALSYSPARVLMQDFTGVPAVVDLAAMRDAVHAAGGDPKLINPQIPVALVIDHSVQVDEFGSKDAFVKNTQKEVARNKERYQLLRWAQESFDQFKVVPPGTGICHQVNVEHLAQVVQRTQKHGKSWLIPDTLVGTDSHTTMVNGLGVLGWGVGGIEAEAAMLGQPISITLPKVVGFKLSGQLSEGVTATDCVLAITEQLRAHGVVGKFVEFYGPGVAQLSLADRATIANMSPEFGATCGYFPVDQVTLDYLSFTGRSAETVACVEAYCKAQQLWWQPGDEEPIFSETLSLDLSSVRPSVAGPKRPQDRVLLESMVTAFAQVCAQADKGEELGAQFPVPQQKYTLGHGDVVIAAITSCTNTSNPAVMMAAGLVAERAVKMGLTVKPWVKTSLAPGSKVVTDYLQRSGLQSSLDALGFQLVGYGCTTCIGNSGPLASPIADAIKEHDLLVCSVLSGNRNFEGRIHPQVKASWLASPPLVVLYALAGSMNIDLHTHVFGQDEQGKDIKLRDLWPSNAAIQEAMRHVDSDMFHKQYSDVFKGDADWQQLLTQPSVIYPWQHDSTYIRKPDFFTGVTEVKALQPITRARILALLGDSITTDHISPAGAIQTDGPAGCYLQAQGVDPLDFNSYGSRRGNHEVMMRGTFANIRLQNEMTPEQEGGVTRHWPSGDCMAIFDAAMAYQKDQVPCVVVAGKEYGTGSSRDWAAKGSYLLGIKAVIAESYERIHRSNLVGMGVLPLQFPVGVTRRTLKLKGDEQISIELSDVLQSSSKIMVTIERADGESVSVSCFCRLDTPQEVAYYRRGGVLRYVLCNMMGKNAE